MYKFLTEIDVNKLPPLAKTEYEESESKGRVFLGAEHCVDMADKFESWRLCFESFGFLEIVTYSFAGVFDNDWHRDRTILSFDTVELLKAISEQKM